MIGVAAGQAGTERVNALLAGFLLMPGESITITNPTNQPANPLGMLVTDTGVEVKADIDFAVHTDKVPLSDADQLLVAMLKGAGGSASAPNRRNDRQRRPLRRLDGSASTVDSA